MPRPRGYEPDRVLDAVESLAVAAGPAAVTIRAIGAAVAVSNGALYHTFGLRSGLTGSHTKGSATRKAVIGAQRPQRAGTPTYDPGARPWPPATSLSM
ncbi:TetR/AcrR family transcriptional regulator [Candidatus Mycobacterium methanotrophicum]|uniref:TetR/AcrR family transcriptional regulator n=1 Tax=Candidatus Mycobacterium methanotrophicum TaxID=2943498 RepID=UPI001C55BE7D